MWLLLNDAFLSIVEKDCARDELLVRARRKGDIDKVFPGANVMMDDRADYLYRARIKRADVKAATAREVDRVSYPNFKESAKDARLHLAYMRVWSALADLQPGGLFRGFSYPEGMDAAPRSSISGRRRRRRRRRSLKRGT